MTDFTEHRKVLEQWTNLPVGQRNGDAARAALAEIDRLTTLVQACGNTECVPLVEVARLRTENEDMRKHLDGLFGIAHPEDGGA
jgi:hypothetical protein